MLLVPLAVAEAMSSRNYCLQPHQQCWSFLSCWKKVLTFLLQIAISNHIQVTSHKNRTEMLLTFFIEIIIIVKSLQYSFCALTRFKWCAWLCRVTNMVSSLLSSTSPTLCSTSKGFSVSFHSGRSKWMKTEKKRVVGMKRNVRVSSGGSRGGAPYLFWVKKEEITEGRKSSRASKSPPPP